MDGLRTPFFILAVVLWVVIVVGEFSSSGLLSSVASSSKGVQSQVTDDVMTKNLADSNMTSEQKSSIVKGAKNQPANAPCYGIQKLTAIDTIAAYALFLMSISIFDIRRLQGSIQGIATLILSLLGLIGIIILIIAGVIKLLIMVSLFMAVPFGTIAYLIIWGFFDRGGAATTLGAIMFLKLAFAVCLILAHQRFLQNKGLVFLILTSLLATLITSFLHGLVPSVLDNITDTLAGLISLILGAIWLIFALIGSIIGIVRVIL